PETNADGVFNILIPFICFFVVAVAVLIYGVVRMRVRDEAARPQNPLAIIPINVGLYNSQLLRNQTIVPPRQVVNSAITEEPAKEDLPPAYDDLPPAYESIH